MLNENSDFECKEDQIMQMKSVDFDKIQSALLI